MNLTRWLLAEARSVRLFMVITVATGLLAAVAVVLQAHLLSRSVTAVFLEGADPGSVSSVLALLLGVIVARAAFPGFGR